MVRVFMRVPFFLLFKIFWPHRHLDYEVLRCMVAGLNKNEIAEKLVIGLGTVKFHISNIFKKFGVDSRVEAIKLAIEQKLVN